MQEKLKRKNKDNLILITVILGLSTIIAAQPNTPLETVTELDLTRYNGKFYEIAKIPNWFQKDCFSGTYAEYSIQDDGDIKVVNTCFTQDGNRKQAIGVAWLVDQNHPGRLKVSFMPFGLKLFAGDYWLMELEKNYEYALVGDPNRKYGWILSRKTILSPQALQHIKLKLETSGYDFGRFEFTKH